MDNGVMQQTKLLLFALGIYLLVAMPAQAALFDHSLYDDILQHYVAKNGGVDYAAIRENRESALQSYFERLADADTDGWPYPEKLAFWINAYNAHVIQFIIDHPDMEKVSEDFEMFNKPLKIAGHSLSLNDVMYRVLRNKKNPDNQGGPILNLSLEKIDPRINFALVAGALSSPRLQNTAYTAENLEDLLKDDVQKAMVNGLFIDAQNGKLQVNAILRWYGKDFLPLGGWRTFMLGLITDDTPNEMALRAFLKSDTNKPVYHYDWTINDVKNLPLNELKTPEPTDAAIIEPAQPPSDAAIKEPTEPSTDPAIKE